MRWNPAYPTVVCVRLNITLGSRDRELGAEDGKIRG